MNKWGCWQSVDPSEKEITIVHVCFFLNSVLGPELDISEGFAA